MKSLQVRQKYKKFGLASAMAARDTLAVLGCVAAMAARENIPMNMRIVRCLKRRRRIVTVTGRTIKCPLRLL